MLDIILSLSIVFCVIFLIVFLVIKSDSISVECSELSPLIEKGYSVKIKISKRKEGAKWKRNSSKAK